MKHFLETSYTYIKNASKHVELEQKKLSITHKVNENFITPKGLELFLRYLCSYVSIWDIKAWKGVISYGLKNCPYLSYIICSLVTNDKIFVSQFLKTEIASKSLRLIVNHISIPDKLNLCSNLCNSLRELSIVNQEISKFISEIYKLASSEVKTQKKVSSDNFYNVNICLLVSDLNAIQYGYQGIMLKAARNSSIMLNYPKYLTMSK